MKNLAELTGILLGDGSLSLRDNNPKSINRLKITLNSQTDKDYTIYISKLLKNLFEIEPIVKYRLHENTVDLFIFRKHILLFLIKNLGLNLSPKWERAVIPKIFLFDDLDLFVLRGYFDTDGSIVTANNNGTLYPRLEMKICPSPMQSQFIDILTKYNFKFGVYDIGNGKIRIQLNGKSQLNQWLNLVGFSNMRHISKLSRFNLNNVL